MLRESRQSDPPAIAAKVRHLVSSAGLRLIEFSLRRKSAPSFIEASCGSLPSDLRGSWVSERAEAKENRKILWNALLSRRMLAHGLIGGNETPGKKRKVWGGAKKLLRSRTVESRSER